MTCLAKKWKTTRKTQSRPLWLYGVYSIGVIYYNNAVFCGWFELGSYSWLCCLSCFCWVTKAKKATTFHSWWLLKTCVHYFLSNFYFSPNDSPSKTEKCFLFHLKSSFHSWDIQIFVFPFCTLFLPVSHCFRGSSKINLEIYDIINCLRKNVITYFL